MSLLIEALDHLNKNKQVEKSNKLTGEVLADDALMLALMPVEHQPEVELERAEAESSAIIEAVEIGEVKELTVDRVLSLAEEAGLTGDHIVASKYAKPKLSVANGTTNVAAKVTDKLLDKTMVKPSTQAGAVKSTLATASSSTHFKNSTSATKTPPAFQHIATELNQKAAAKVFVANQAGKPSSSKSALVILGVAGALSVWLGLQGYDYIKILTAPDVVVNSVATTPSMHSQPQLTTAEIATIAPAELSIAKLATESATPNQENLLAESQTALDKAATNGAGKTKASALENKALGNNVLGKKVPENQLKKAGMLEDVVQAEPEKLRTNKTSNEDNEVNTDSFSSYHSVSGSNAKRKPMKLISKAASSGVDPTLMAAYQAYTRGDDIAAQQQYRQVLQRDVRNVDALLGMAAIAQRQSRDADAAGWYQKVLEIEPSNTIALSAMVGGSGSDPQVNTDAVATESRIKNMLAQQPDAANLYAALGNLYVGQSQWASAQEAYFNASRLAPNNADYVFNLAISLDQMGKTRLALMQYERALAALNKSGGTSPDRATLEARIRELQ
jgi:tetratricopeptide (TPR) repeat protein